MDVIEKAIRGAFEKGDADSRTFRERVYRSAFAALDRALQANPGVTVETAISRRKALQAKITEIEQEYIPALGGLGRSRSPARGDGDEAGTPGRTAATRRPSGCARAASRSFTAGCRAGAADRRASAAASRTGARVPAPPPASEPPPPAAVATEPEIASPPRKPVAARAGAPAAAIT